MNQKSSNLCLHSIRRSNCLRCNPKKRCLHNCNKYICKECNGSGLCQHGIQKYGCRACGGKEFCIHGKRRSHCKECDGKSLCIHEKLRRFCVECGGSSICEHGKQRTKCMKCGVNNFCCHQKEKYACKRCIKSCQHGKITYKCETCFRPLKKLVDTLNLFADTDYESFSSDSEGQAKEQSTHIQPEIITIQPGCLVNISGNSFCISEPATGVVVKVGQKLPQFIERYPNFKYRIPAGTVICLNSKSICISMDTFGYEIAAQQPSSLPAQQPTYLPAQQPTYLPAQPSSSLPAQQPISPNEQCRDLTLESSIWDMFSSSDEDKR